MAVPGPIYGLNSASNRLVPSRPIPSYTTQPHISSFDDTVRAAMAPAGVTSAPAKKKKGGPTVHPPQELIDLNFSARHLAGHKFKAIDVSVTLLVGSKHI